MERFWSFFQMGSTIFLLSLLSFVFPYYIFLQPHTFVAGDVNLIQNTCQSTKYYDLCLSCLKSDPTSLTSDTKGLAIIMVGKGIANATATSSYLSSQLLATTNDTLKKKVLKECSDKYTYAGDALQASVQDLADESYDYANMHITAAADYPNVCHNTFKRYPALPYPPELARREDTFKRICSVVLGIIDLLG